MPANINGSTTPKEHNLGLNTDDDPYTSWTTNVAVAEQHAAEDGPGGVLLRVPVGVREPAATWHWEISDDVFFEGEVLMWGYRYENVEVFPR